MFLERDLPRSLVAAREGEHIGKSNHHADQPKDRGRPRRSQRASRLRFWEVASSQSRNRSSDLAPRIFHRDLPTRAFFYCKEILAAPTNTGKVLNEGQSVWAL